jgi:hypothetical protein
VAVTVGEQELGQRNPLARGPQTGASQKLTGVDGCRSLQGGRSEVSGSVCYRPCRHCTAIRLTAFKLTTR